MSFGDKSEGRNTTAEIAAGANTALIEINLDDLIQITSNVDDVSPTAGDFDGAAGLSGTDDFYNRQLLIFSSGALAGLARNIGDYTGSSKNIILTNPFPVAPANGDNFSIVGFESVAAGGGDASLINQTLIKDGGDADWENTDSLHDIKAGLDALDIAAAKPGIAISDIATTTENDCIIIDLNSVGHVYRLEHLRIKSADPTGVITVTVNLYEEINDVETKVDFSIINTDNYGTYFSLMDLFGLDNVKGDLIKVTCLASAGSGVAILGQYGYADAIVS